MEEVPESALIDVFDHIKGDNGKNRAYINFEDFKRCCLENNPQCLQEKSSIKDSTAEAMQDFINECELYFRNICESANINEDDRLSNVSHESPRFSNLDHIDDGAITAEASIMSTAENSVTEETKK